MVETKAGGADVIRVVGGGGYTASLLDLKRRLPISKRMNFPKSSKRPNYIVA